MSPQYCQLSLSHNKKKAIRVFSYSVLKAWLLRGMGNKTIVGLIRFSNDLHVLMITKKC